MGEKCGKCGALLHRLLWALLLSCVIGVLVLACLARAPACAPAMPKGKEKAVEIASESALIVWDQKARKQHFIRRASFQAELPYFGFLVPTPTQPELAEAPDEVFSLLEDWTKPETVTEKRYVERSLVRIGCPGASTFKKAERGGVEVLAHVGDVGGYDAKVLRASDTDALGAWLEKHGYDARPALMKWLDPYVKEGWIITAFQIVKKEEQTRQITPQAVRMSFTTARPFFPYSEPEGLREAEKVDAPGERRKNGQGEGRLLRIFFLANQRMQGALDEREATWSGKTAWAGRLDGERRQALATRLSPGVNQPEATWLTVFDDHASPRPGKTDLFFSPSSEQSEVRRPPIIRYERVERTPSEEIIGLLVCAGMFISPVLFLGWRRWRKRRSGGL